MSGIDEWVSVGPYAIQKGRWRISAARWKPEWWYTLWRRQGASWMYPEMIAHADSVQELKDMVDGFRGTIATGD